MGQLLFFFLHNRRKIGAVPIFTIFLSLFLLSSIAHAVGLGQLMEISRAQKDAQRAYADETKAYGRVKSAVDKGAIKKGDSRKSIGDRYGEPVVSIIDANTKREKWIYKPASSSFFEGVKVYLYFDKDDKLDEVKLVE